MRRIPLFAFCLAMVMARGVSGAAEPGAPSREENARKLHPYIYCDGFAGGVRGVGLDRRPQTAEPWREVGVAGNTRRVSVVDGYRVVYSYPRKFYFATLKAERSHPSRYAADRQAVSSTLVEMARLDGGTTLVEFHDQGFSGQSLAKKELSGSTLGMTQIYADEDAVIVTIFFHNHVPEMRKFQTHEEFTSLRDRFVTGYVECVARKRAGAK